MRRAAGRRATGGARILLSVARRYPRCLTACKSWAVSGIAAVELACGNSLDAGLFPHAGDRGGRMTPCFAWVNRGGGRRRKSASGLRRVLVIDIFRLNTVQHIEASNKARLPLTNWNGCHIPDNPVHRPT